MNLNISPILRRFSAGLAVAAATLAASAGQAAALAPVNATYQTIDYPGAAWTDVTGVATTGTSFHTRTTYVGTFQDIQGLHGFVLSNGQFTKLDVPNGTETQALGVNRLGQVVGTYVIATGNAGGLTCGFSYSAGTYNLADPGHNCSSFDSISTYLPTAINDAGRVVGSYDAYYDNSTNTGHYEGFLGTTGSVTQNRYDVSGSHGTLIFGINNAATPELVGSYLDSSNHRHAVAFTGQNTTGTPFDVPGTPVTEARGVDDTGRIVGWYRWATATHGFVDDKGTFVRVDYPNALDTRVNGINNPASTLTTGSSYLIVGHYDNGYGPGGAQAWHGFVATVSKPRVNAQ